MLEIAQGDLYAYSGNYAYYLEKKTEAESAAASAKRKHAGTLRREFEWLKRGPKVRSTRPKVSLLQCLDLLCSP